ncbi:MAG: DUF3828 domain-containing protein [Chthoniobacterales bacterium]
MNAIRKITPALGLLALALFSALPALAADESSSPKAAAQTFYDAYMKVLLAKGDTQKFVLSSDAVTKGFLKAYKALIADGMDSDPVICGQDYPDEGFSASKAKIEDDGKATVTMKSRGDQLKHSFKVTLRKVDGRWLISDTNDLKADADD